MKKVIKNILLSLLSIIIILLLGCCLLWKDELSTILSLKKIVSYNDEHNDGDVYTIKYKGGYYFEDLLNEGGVSSDDELRYFVADKVTKGISIPALLEGGCSSFTCASEDGDRLFCRNFDLSRSNTAIVYTKPGNGRYASIGTADLKFVGISKDTHEFSLIDKIKTLGTAYSCMDGMNEKGLAISIYVSYQGVTIDEKGDAHMTKTDINTDKPDLTSSLLLRLVLDYASTVDEAIELIKQYDYHDSSTNAFHFSISDASGKAVCLEWFKGTNNTDLDGSKRELHLTYSEGTDPFVVTNFILVDGYYENEEDKKGLDRYETVKAALKERNNIVKDEEDAMSILNNVGVRTMVSEGRKESTTSVTLYSVIYNLTNKTITFCANEHYNPNFDSSKNENEDIAFK